jgi:hypothetical protein
VGPAERKQLLLASLVGRSFDFYLKKIRKRIASPDVAELFSQEKASFYY